MPVKIGGGSASSTNPDDFCSFNELAPYIEHFDGVGFVFTESDPYCGIDIDDCIDSEGELHPVAKEIVDRFNSYTEISPSGTGLKIFIKGRKNTHRCKISIPDSDVTLELYDTKRFFTVTSDIYEDAPLTIRDSQTELKEFENKYFPTTNKGSTSKARAKELSEPEINEIIAKIRKSSDGTTFTELYDQGNIVNYDDDHSKADYALLCVISKYCGRNRIAMERIFSQSALGKRNKWANRKDYRERTIERVLMDTSDNKEDLYSTLLKDHYILGKKIIRIDLTDDGGYHITETSTEVVNVKVGATTRKQKDQW